MPGEEIPCSKGEGEEEGSGNRGGRGLRERRVLWMASVFTEIPLRLLLSADDNSPRSRDWLIICFT